MRGDPLELVDYDPAPVTWMRSPGAAGQLIARGAAQDHRERAPIDALRALATRSDARARELAGRIRTLALFTSVRLGEALDLRWLRGLHALEHLVVESNTGIAHAGALGELPALQHATLYANQRNRITDLSEIGRSRSLHSLDLWWGGLGDLRALSGMRSLRRLSVHDNRSFSLDGIEGLPIEVLELCLPDEPCDLRAAAALRSLRTLTLQGSVVRTTAPPRTWLRSLLATRDAPAWDVHAISALPAAMSIALDAGHLARLPSTGPALPVTSLSIARLDDDGVRALARAPRLRTLRVARLDATSLAPLAAHPALAELRFDAAPSLATRFPAALRPLVQRGHLRGLVNRLGRTRRDER